MMEETRKDEPTLVSEPAAIYYGTSQVTNPLAMLDQLGDMVKATSKTSEQLIGEHLAEKYNLWDYYSDQSRMEILTPSAFVEKYINE